MVDQHSAPWVKLSDIVEGLEFQSDECFSYLNTTTGEVVSVTLEELRAAEEGQPRERLPWCGVRNMACGGSGGMALALTDAYPHLHATVIDLPTVTPITQRFIAEADATDRVQVVAADVVNAPVPGTYDVAVLRSLLQVLSPEDAMQALTHIGAALRPGGRLYIVGRILDDTRLSPVDTVGFNVVFLNIFDEGRAYTEGEHRTWLTALGFVEIARVPLPEGVSIITARKPV